MEIVKVVILVQIAYLMGSFSSALWYCKWFKKIDIREYGSKNAGSTNVLRVLGWKFAIPVFITDVLKSFIPAMFFVKFLDVADASEAYYMIQLLFGIAAIIGHIFPIFSGFKGGKGVASMLGVVLALYPLAAALSLAVFIIVVAITRIVSVSSMSAGVAFPIIVLILNGTKSITLLVFAICAAVILIITHRKNIKRLLKGEEGKITVGKKK